MFQILTAFVTILFLLGLLGIGVIATLRNYIDDHVAHPRRCWCPECQQECRYLRDHPVPPYIPSPPVGSSRAADARWRRYQEHREALVARNKARGMAGYTKRRP